MEMGFSISYIFEDKDWLKKLLPLVGLGIVSLIPIFGLLAGAISLGFMLQLARNVRQGLPLPLPGWKDLPVKFEMGGQLLLAILAYHLPIVVLSSCSALLVNGVGGGFMGATVYFFILCCTTPMLLVYTMIIWPMLAIGAAEFIETNEWGRLFRPLHLWDVLRTNSSLSFRWLLYVLLVDFVLALLILLPCLGWALIFFFGYPVQGHLLGQFAHRLSLSNKPQAAPRKRPAPR